MRKFWAADRPPQPLAANVGCNRDLTRSNSDASSLTAENCKDIFRGPAHAMPNDCTAWTNEKHNLYLRHLEVSFFEQLYQLKSQCSEQNQREKSIWPKWMINDPEQLNILQYGCRKKISSVRAERLYGSTSAESHDVECKKNFNMSMNSHQSSAKMPACRRKRMISHGIPASRGFSSSIPYYGYLIDQIREGTGQNFLDEGNQCTSNIDSRAKKLKTTLEDHLHEDQIVPSRIFPTANCSVIKNGHHVTKLSE